MKITKTQLENLIRKELSEMYTHPGQHPEPVVEDDELEEGIENINPENLQVALDVIEKMATQPEVAGALAVGGLVAAISAIRKLVKNDASPASPGTNKFQQAASVARDYKQSKI